MPTVPDREGISERAEQTFLKRRLLNALGLDDSYLGHLNVMCEALVVHGERSAAYGDHWRENGALDNLNHGIRKLRRQRAILEAGSGEGFAKGGDDDAIDAINYAAFAVRNMRNGRIDNVDDGE